MSGNNYKDLLSEFAEAEAESGIKSYSKNELDDFERELMEMEKEELKDVVFETVEQEAQRLQKEADAKLLNELESNKNEKVSSSDVNQLNKDINEMSLLSKAKSKIELVNSGFGEGEFKFKVTVDKPNKPNNKSTFDVDDLFK